MVSSIRILQAICLVNTQRNIYREELERDREGGSIMRAKTPENNAILIVGDIANIGVLFDYLRGFGFRVLAVDDGESALQITEHARPDIILLDVMLPGIDGFETCRRLKERETTQNIPVIFITALANTIDKVRAFALGAVDYVTKPIQSEEVLARVRTHLTIQNLQRRLEEKNARLQKEIAERERLIEELDAFAHTVAHDLKNPLGVSINYARFLSKYCTEMGVEELQKYSQRIVRSGQKMNDIIEALLLLASVRKEEVDLRPLNMAHIVTEAQSRLAYMIRQYQAEIILPAGWPTALGYGPWVEEVWVNYLSNGIKYGGQPPRLELGATSQADGMLQFWVRDNGDGLMPEDQTRVFVPFTRLDQDRADGHGLGLSIVQRIVEKLGGEVDVKSDGVPGQGSVFSFTLPPSTQT
jgi:two-component system sensor histidine kinase/response regulator